MAIFRKGLVRVSLAADGQDPQLDKELASLRSELRKERDITELEPLINGLEELIKALDHRRKDEGVEARSSLEQSLTQFLDLGIPREAKSQIKSFRKELPQLLAGNVGTPELWKKLSQLHQTIQQYIDTLKHQDEKNESGGFLSRLFSGGSKDVPKQDGPGDEEPAQVQEHDANVAGISAENREHIRQRVASVLTNLLTQIDLPDNLVSRKQTLLSRIQAEFSWEELPDFLSETADLVASTRLVAQQEFEGFLLTLHARLNDIQEFLQTARKGEEESQINQAKLDEEVRSELQDIRGSMERSSDVGQIKIDIEQMVGRIINAIDEFHHTEKERRDAVYERIEYLGQRLESMEEEATRLKDNLEAARVQALKDALTDLPNRQAYDELIEREYSRWKRHGHPLSIAVADIDHFKQINDSLGHLRGDKVLKLVAREISRRVRSEDFVARYGGEEFVIVMPDTDEQSALAALEKVRASIEDCPFNFANERVPVTCSFGVAGFKEDDSIESCFERADKALYQAKGNGRNRVERLN